MYIGRIVSVAMTPAGEVAGLYRVSSRSFPNRTAVVDDAKVRIVPKAGHEGDVLKNPYIAYNCVRVVRENTIAVVTNGSQTDPIAEKIEQGMSIRDALALSHLAMDFEKDQYNTPRISAVVDRVKKTGWLATIRDNGLEVREMPLEPGYFFYVATYEENTVSLEQGDTCEFSDAVSACNFILGEGVFAERTNPVTAVCAVAAGPGFSLLAKDAAAVGG
ncbi:MAG: IMP cyclohydrolase [Candidatus Hydrogenedentes bacterium]|nr:IMP cyclohydrolase [Candidatus Hydrogenedentota bacterium]